MKYSWKAVTCCVSKSLLVFLAIGCGIGGCWGAAEFAANRRDAHCAELRLAAESARDELAYKVAVEKYEEDCVTKSESNPLANGIALGVFGFVFGGFFLYLLCSMNITYCQVAVDTGRKPWHWIWGLPKWLGGDPLPGREMIESCRECHTMRAETDEEYRARVIGNA